MRGRRDKERIDPADLPPLNARRRARRRVLTRKHREIAAECEEGRPEDFDEPEPIGCT